MVLWLRILGSACAAQEFYLEHFPFVIGRKRDSNGWLPFAYISRSHCQFICTENQVLIQDLESYNGTFINGQRVTQPVPVKDGDEITLGPISFRLEMPTKWQDTIEARIPATQPEIVKMLS